MIPAPLQVARSLAADIRASSAETEAGRRLAPALVAKMTEAGLFRLCVPRDLGGFEADPRLAIEVLEEVARADGAAGWCLMVAITSSLVAGYLDEATARAILGDPGAILSGVFAPRGVARVAPGGYRVTGRWPFASGCQHATWLLGGAVILEESGAPRLGPGNVPETRMMIFPASEVTIHDTWNVVGLAGTGSHDIEVEDAFVPAARSVSFLTDPLRRAGALHAFPVFGLLALGVSAVALGIAQSAADSFRELATAKTPFGGKRTLAARPAVQTALAEITAQISAARAFLHAAIERGAEATRAGDIPLAIRAEMRLAACHATTSAARAVDLAYGAAGGSSIYASSPLQRCFRDVHVATQHVMVGPVIQELVGKVLAGLDAETSML